MTEYEEAELERIRVLGESKRVEGTPEKTRACEPKSIGVFFAILLFYLLGPTQPLFSSRGTPNLKHFLNALGVTTAFSSAIKEGQYDKAYLLLSDAARLETARSVFIEKVSRESIFQEDLSSAEVVKTLKEAIQEGESLIQRVDYVVAEGGTGIKIVRFEVLARDGNYWINGYKVLSLEEAVE